GAPVHRSKRRARGSTRRRAHAAQGGADPLCRAVVERARAAAYPRGRRRPAHLDRHHWQHWLDRGRFPDHRWRSFLQRSALTLKGLTFAPTGAVVAAATTSLPETPGGVRNWDYRYTWIRDTAATLWALYALGFDWEA